METQMVSYRYEAFISYRHVPQDSKVAKEIQDRLERFHIPSSVRKQYGTDRINRIFRDQEELEVTSDLAMKLDQNLRDSEYLIAICSPDYLESRWCMKEIHDFLQYHDRDHIICVIAGGEPPHVFPEELMREEYVTYDSTGVPVRQVRSIEPLAIDYRGDTRKAAKTELPRIAAKIIGCSYDELMMRRERYQKKRNTIIFSAAFAVAALALTYLLWSNGQIRKNYRQVQINESRILAADSIQSLEDKDRLRALKRALEGLPEKGDRPMVDDSLYALARASYLYRTPYQYLETWMVDPENRITDYFFSSDGRYLVYLDISGRISTVDMQQRKTVNIYRLEGASSAPEHMEELYENTLVTYAGGDIIASDYTDGSTIWRLSSQWRTIGRAERSHDGSYAALAEPYAVQLMTPQGKEYASLPLPKTTNGYIVDMEWAPDDRHILVKIRYNSKGYGLGLYDLADFSFREMDGSFAETMDAFGFTGNDEIFEVSHVPGERRSIISRDEKQLIDTSYTYSIFDREKLRFSKTIVSNIPDIRFFVSGMGDEDKGTVVAGGDDLYIFGHDGTMKKQLDTGSTVISMVYCGKDACEVILEDGYDSVFYFDYPVMESDLFYPEYSVRATVISDSEKGTSVAVEKDGNLYFFEKVYDDSIHFYEGDGLESSISRMLVSGRSAAVSCYDTVMFYDLDSRQMISSMTFDGNSVIYPLDSFDDMAVFLKLDFDTKEVTLMYFSISKGGFIEEKHPGLRDFFLSQSYFTTVEEPGAKEYMEVVYTDRSYITVRDHMLYGHDGTDTEKIIIYDLRTGNTSSFKLTMPEGYRLQDSSVLRRPSDILVMDSSHLYTTMYNEQIGVIKPIIIDLKTGGYIIPETDVTDESMAYAAEGYVTLEGLYGTETRDVNGKLINAVPSNGKNLTSFCWHEGRLYLIYTDCTMEIYEGSTLKRTIQLSFREELYQDLNKMFRYEFHGDRLYMFYAYVLDVIDLSSDGTLPLYCVDGDIVGYIEDRKELIMHAYDGSRNDYLNYLGWYDELTPEQMIERGRAQLESLEGK